MNRSSAVVSVCRLLMGTVQRHKDVEFKQPMKPTDNERSRSKIHRVRVDLPVALSVQTAAGPGSGQTWIKIRQSTCALELGPVRVNEQKTQSTRNFRGRKQLGID